MNFLNKLFQKSKNLNYISLKFKELNQRTEVKKIFNAIRDFSENSEVRYVGGCVRKIINRESIDDIDLATNITPEELMTVLDKNDIKFYETGIEHGTVTAIIDNIKFEITSLRKDIKTDGRHAKVEYSQDWHEDASRRDFSINSIYSDIEGNLFDPFNGKKKIEDGVVEFIGEEEKRIKEDYLRILRYVRFFLNYSKVGHSSSTIKAIKKNLSGMSKISSERLLDEFKKLSRSEGFLKLGKDKFCLEIIILIFPQFKQINIIKNITKKNIKNLDFIILISLLINDGSDNIEYFFYRFNISNNDKKRILFLKNFFSSKTNKKTFSRANLWKEFYLNGKQTLFDLLNYQILKSYNSYKELFDEIEFFKDKKCPTMPVNANFLMEHYNFEEGKELGVKLKKIEEKWLNNNFKISENEIKKLLLS